MKRMNVYICYILCAALIFASPSYSIAQTATPSKAAENFCANTEAITDGAAINPQLSTGGASGPEKNQSGKGLTQACTTLQGAADYLKKNINTFRANGVISDNFDEIKKGYDEYEKSRKVCLEGHAGASTMCMEDTSPELAGGAADANNIMTLMGAGANDNCSKAGQAMDMAKKALTAFSGACGGAKANCTNNCDKAASGAQKLKAQAEAGIISATCKGQTAACQSDVQNYKTALQQAITAGMQEADNDELTSVAGKSQNCTKDMGKMLTSALGGVLSMLGGMMQANKCDEETAGEEKPKDEVIADKCIKPENATLQECICLKYPRTVGCSNSFDKGTQTAGGQLGTGLTDKANVDPEASSSTISGGGPLGIEQSPLNNRGDDGSSIGAPTGGGASLSGGGGGGSGGAGAPAEGGSPRKTLNANILSGGGGGAGGFRPGSAGGSDGNGEYRAYLPGGTKDPSKGLSGQAWTREVTGQGGKSNWDKVKERYIENRNSLISN